MTKNTYDPDKKYGGTTDKETLKNATDFVKKIKKDKKEDVDSNE